LSRALRCGSWQQMSGSPSSQAAERLSRDLPFMAGSGEEGPINSHGRLTADCSFQRTSHLNSTSAFAGRRCLYWTSSNDSLSNQRRQTALFAIPIPGCQHPTDTCKSCGQGVGILWSVESLMVSEKSLCWSSPGTTRILTRTDHLHHECSTSTPGSPELSTNRTYTGEQLVSPISTLLITCDYRDLTSRKIST
jgi:hypothetical protein